MIMTPALHTCFSPNLLWPPFLVVLRCRLLLFASCAHFFVVSEQLVLCCSLLVLTPIFITLYSSMYLN